MATGFPTPISSKPTTHSTANFAAQAWTAHFFTRADGSRTTAELLDQLKADGALHPETPPAAFAEMLATLISGGFLQV